MVAISWELRGQEMSVNLTVPTGAMAHLDLEGRERVPVGPGEHGFTVRLDEDGSPPRSLGG
jgi:hypothetical protein